MYFEEGKNIMNCKVRIKTVLHLLTAITLLLSSGNLYALTSTGTESPATAEPLLAAPWAAAPLMAAPIAESEIDTSFYNQFPFVRFVFENDSLTMDDEAFMDAAAKIIFPVNKYNLPQNNPTLRILREQILPHINADSLQLVRIMLRGAASPEGSLRNNERLAKGRSKSLYDFLSAHLDHALADSLLLHNVESEDYRLLCIMMQQAGDPDYDEVQALCNEYLPQHDYISLKNSLKQAHGGKLWRRLLHDYFPQLRAARFVLYFAKYVPEPEFPERTRISMMPIRLEPESTPIDTIVPNVDLNVESQTEPRFMSISNNVLYDLSLTPNLRVGVQLSKHWSVGFTGSFLHFPRGNFTKTKWRHLLLSPNVRYWWKSAEKGPFVGANIMYSHFNAGYKDFVLYEGTEHERRQGDLVGLGAKLGYKWHLGGRWNLEVFGGLAAAHAWYDQFVLDEHGDRWIPTGNGKSFLLLPQPGLNIVYHIPLKQKSQTITNTNF
jgi:hypothetical protein